MQTMKLFAAEDDAHKGSEEAERAERLAVFLTGNADSLGTDEDWEQGSVFVCPHCDNEYTDAVHFDRVSGALQLQGGGEAYGTADEESAR